MDTGFIPVGLDMPYRVFISEDPIGLAGGINQFAYVGNNPVNWIDPLGLWAYYFGGSGTAALGRGINAAAGFAYDSKNGGWGYYYCYGESAGIAAGIGGEMGGYSGGLSGSTATATGGIFWGSIGGILGGDGGLGLVGSVNAGLPFQATLDFAKCKFVPFNKPPMQPSKCH